MPAKKSIFIFGLGYVGSRLAESLLVEGWQVSGTCTNLLKAQAYKEMGIKAYLFDDQVGPLVQAEGRKDFLSCTHILATIPPSLFTTNDPLVSVDPVLREHGVDLRRAAELNGQLQWIGYMSSTGVYGDRDGSWVTERDVIR